MERYYPLNSFRLCIDGYENDSLLAFIYSPLADKKIVVNDFTKMVLDVDRYFESYDYPKAYQHKRSFSDDKVIMETDKTKIKYPIDEIVCKQGQVATFDIIVTSRQHTNWQGIVKNIKGEIVYRFSSELLLIEFLINSLV